MKPKKEKNNIDKMSWNLFKYDHNFITNRHYWWCFPFSTICQYIVSWFSFFLLLTYYYKIEWIEKKISFTSIVFNVHLNLMFTWMMFVSLTMKIVSNKNTHVTKYTTKKIDWNKKQQQQHIDYSTQYHQQ